MLPVYNRRAYFHHSLHEAVVYLLKRWDSEDDGNRLGDYQQAVYAELPEASPGEP